jgi:hypothetical protein
MPQSHSNTGPSLIGIERPRCPKCDQLRMSLVRLAAGPKGFDIRTFECGKCGHIQIFSIESDPLKSTKAGWIHSDLYRPK